MVSQDGYRDTRGLYSKRHQAVYDEGFFVEHRFGDGGHGGWKSASIHSFVEKGKDLDMGWFHTKNPEGHGLREDDVEGLDRDC